MRVVSFSRQVEMGCKHVCQETSVRLGSERSVVGFPPVQGGDENKCRKWYLRQNTQVLENADVAYPS